MENQLTIRVHAPICSNTNNTMYELLAALHQFLHYILSGELSRIFI